MSIALMNAVWKSDLPSTRKFVALSLADQANDSGECYPSIQLLCERCSLSERAVRITLRELEAWGVIRSDHRLGRSTVYQFADPAAWRTPAADAPRHDVPPAAGAPQGGTTCPTGGASHAGEGAPHAPITTTIPPIEPPPNHQTVGDGPVDEPRKRRRTPAIGFVPPEWVDPGAWAGFIEMRKAKRSPPTQRACELVVGELQKLQQQGHDPAKVLEQSTRNCWVDVYPLKGPQHANRSTGGTLSAVERVRANNERAERGRCEREAIDGDYTRVG